MARPNLLGGPGELSFFQQNALGVAGRTRGEQTDASPDGAGGPARGGRLSREQSLPCLAGHHARAADPQTTGVLQPLDNHDIGREQARQSRGLVRRRLRREREKRVASGECAEPDEPVLNTTRQGEQDARRRVAKVAPQPVDGCQRLRVGDGPARLRLDHERRIRLYARPVREVVEEDGARCHS